MLFGSIRVYTYEFIYMDMLKTKQAEKDTMWYNFKFELNGMDCLDPLQSGFWLVYGTETSLADDFRKDLNKGSANADLSIMVEQCPAYQVLAAAELPHVGAILVFIPSPKAAHVERIAVIHPLILPGHV